MTKKDKEIIQLLNELVKTQKELLDRYRDVDVLENVKTLIVEESSVPMDYVDRKWIS